MTDKLSGYSTTPGSNNAAVPDGWPEGMLPSDVNNCAREGMARVREWYEDAAWINLGHTVVSATSSTIVVSGDQTAFYVAGRALRADGTDYGWVSSSTYGAPNTTINVTGFSVSGTPTTVEVGILSASNQLAKSLTIQTVSIPTGLTVSGTAQYTGTVTFGTTTSGVTQTSTDSSTLIATTAFVQSAKKLRKSAYAEYTTQFQGSSYIFPDDGSKPQNTEGKEFFSESFTPTAADSVIVVTVTFQGSASDNRPTVAIFKDSGADALSVSAGMNADTDHIVTVVCKYKEVAGSTSARTYKAQAAANGTGGGNAVSINRGITTANPYGTVLVISTMEIMEYAP